MKTEYRLRQVVWYKEGIHWSSSQGSIIAIIQNLQGMFYDIALSDGTILRLPEKNIQAVKRKDMFKLVK